MVKTVSSLQKSLQTAPTSSYTGPTITCTICSASYAPTQASLAQASSIALESAFMSMCHFCFRCRRPSCPLCWDDVHTICGACDEEVHLPFRREGEPLPMNSTLLKAATRRGLVRPQHYPLVCISPGRFQGLVPASEKALNTDPVEIPTVPPATPKTTKRLNSQLATKKLAPQQVEQKATTQQEAVASPTRVQPPAPIAKPKQRVSVVHRIERTITLTLGIVIFLAAVLILVATLSPQANSLIAQVLHVDIRKEMEYLLQLIQQHL